MDRDKIVAVLAEALEVEPEQLQDETALDDIDTYDSAAVLGLMAAVDMELGLRVDPDRLVACTTIGEMVALVQETAAQ